MSEVRLHVGSFGDPRGVGVSYERGTPGVSQPETDGEMHIEFTFPRPLLLRERETDKERGRDRERERERARKIERKRERERGRKRYGERERTFEATLCAQEAERAQQISQAPAGVTAKGVHRSKETATLPRSTIWT